MRERKKESQEERGKEGKRRKKKNGTEINFSEMFIKCFLEILLPVTNILGARKNWVSRFLPCGFTMKMNKSSMITLHPALSFCPI